MRLIARLRRALISFALWTGARGRRVFAADIIASAAAIFVGYSMRLSYYMMDGAYLNSFGLTLVAYTAVILAAVAAGGAYKVLWTRAGVEEYARFSLAYFAGTCVFTLIYIVAYPVNIPRSSFLIFVLLAYIFMAAGRALLSLAYVGRGSLPQRTRRAIIVGAGAAGTMLARDLLRSSSEMTPVAFIDDDPALRGMRAASLEILGGREVLSAAIRDLHADAVLLAIPSASGSEIAEYMKILSREKVTVRVLPSLITLAAGKGERALRPVQLEDLLHREPIKLDDENIRSAISGRTVLVTGAGGSIGSEICRQILARGPRRLIALGHGEHSIYTLLESLADAKYKIPVISVIADTADKAAMRAVFAKYKPQIVFHAAAHKHVPLMEGNPREALRVNACGTMNTASIAGEYGAERFVMISTDKAVHPKSIMGATKRAAERLVTAAARKYPATKYMAVRFGNVLGSRGSVVPKFERQIAAGGPVTVTDRRMERYFILIPEAVSLVLQACAMGTGGELFVLDMAQPVNIYEMAETLIRLHGYEPGRDIKITCTGIRAGEKLTEELFFDPSLARRTAHDKIFKCPLADGATDENILQEVMDILDRSVSGKLSDDDLRKAILALGK